MQRITVCAVAVALLGCSETAVAQSNISPSHKNAWGENVGWTNWRDANGATDGVIVHETYLSGYIWCENVGWLNVGDGNGPYANTTDQDFGVNIEPGGDLNGYAWGENIGWVNFDTGSAEPDQARFDSDAGRFRGYAWGENVGWINLDDATHFVGTIPRRPRPEDCSTIGSGTKCNDSGTCTTDADCWQESHCVPAPLELQSAPGVCYAPKTRFLSIAANPGQMAQTARRVKLDTGTVLGWVGQPHEEDPLQEPGTIWLAEIVDDPVYVATWPNVIHVMGCEIAHASLCDVGGLHCDPNECPEGEICVHHRYWIQAIKFGDPIGDEAHYSEVLELQTTRRWGDVVSTIVAGDGRPPEHVVGLEDVIAEIKKYQITDIAPIVWLDIDPSGGNSVPDQNIGIGDILKVIDGYGGNPYPGLGPLNCP